MTAFASYSDQIAAAARRRPGLLVIVQRIAGHLGGQVAVESRLGAGSTFSFTLPRYEGAKHEGQKV